MKAVRYMKRYMELRERNADAMLSTFQRLNEQRKRAALAV